MLSASRATTMSKQKQLEQYAQERIKNSPLRRAETEAERLFRERQNQTPEPKKSN